MGDGECCFARPDPVGSPSSYSGINTPLAWLDTLKREGRNPDNVFQVTIQNDAAFDASVAASNAAKKWYFWPNGSTSTQCSYAAANALKAGGIKGLYTGNPALPDFLGADLSIRSEISSSGVFRLPAAPW